MVMNKTFNILFRSDDSYVGSGFKIYFMSTLWYMEDPANDPESSDIWNENYRISNNEIWPCISKNITYITEEKFGILLSPNHPNEYPNYSNCSWVINVPNTSQMTLQFLSFDIEVGFKIMPICSRIF